MTAKVKSFIEGNMEIIDNLAAGESSTTTFCCMEKLYYKQNAVLENSGVTIAA